MSGCAHPAYVVKEGNLICSACGQLSQSKRWPENVHGKAVEQGETENKGRIWPPESKRLPGRPGRR